MYNIGPASHLGADIEEFGDDALAVVGVVEESVQAFADILEACLSPFFVIGEREDGDEHQDDEHHGYDIDVGLYEDVQVEVLQEVELLHGQVQTVFGAHGAEPFVYRHGHHHTDDSAEGVERLDGVQALHAVLFTTHLADVGVATGLQKRQPAGQNEVGSQKGIELAHELGGQKHQCAQGIEDEAHQDAFLERETLDEQGRRDGHEEVAHVEGNGHQRGFDAADAEYLGEGVDHRRGHIVGKAPQGKTCGNQNQYNEVILIVLMACYVQFFC